MLECLLQPTHLLRAEGGPRPPLTPAAPARRLRFRALPAGALALVARGLVGAQPSAVRGCRRDGRGGGEAFSPNRGPPPLRRHELRSRPTPAFFLLPPFSPTWLRQVALAGLLGTGPTPPLRAGLAVQGLFRLRTPPSGLGPGREGIAAAALRGGGAGRGDAADVGPHPVGFVLCQGKVGLTHGGEGLGLSASISSYTGASVPSGLVCKCEATSKWESSRDNSCQRGRKFTRLANVYKAPAPACLRGRGNPLEVQTCPYPPGG